MNQITRFDTTTLGLVLLVGLVFHVALLALGRKWDTLGLLMGMFFVLAPLSAAILVPGVEIIKWARVYISVLMVVSAGLLYRSVQMGPLSSLLLVYTLFYCGAAVWSESMVQGLAIKGLFGVVVVAGLLMGNNMRDLRHVRLAIRLGAAFSLIWILLVPLGIAMGRAEIIFGRLAAWGLNANRLGHELAAMLICTSWVAIYDPSKPWKLYGFLTSGAIALIIVLTGSRASLAMAVLAAGCYAVPLLKRPGVLIGFGVGLAAIVGITLAFGQTSASGRFGEVNLVTREGVWEAAFEAWRQSPVIGIGWAIAESTREGGGSANFHSMYIQALVETGVVGLLFLLLVCFTVVIRSLLLLRRTFGDPYAPYACFAAACAVATIAHGAAESGTIQGSNINSLLLALGIALLDRVPRLIAQEHEHDEHAHGEQQWLDAEYAAAYGVDAEGHAYDPAQMAGYTHASEEPDAPGRAGA